MHAESLEEPTISWWNDPSESFPAALLHGRSLCVPVLWSAVGCWFASGMYFAVSAGLAGFVPAVDFVDGHRHSGDVRFFD